MQVNYPPLKQSKSGMYSRGYIPHVDNDKVIQGISFRLHDSIPKSKLAVMTQQIASFPVEKQDFEKRKRIERYLDNGYGCCALAHPVIARSMQETLEYFNKQRYTLHAWVIMPNHVHVLFQAHHPLGKIIQTWKRQSASEMLKLNDPLNLGLDTQTRTVWQREYYDRYIRNDEHYAQAMKYIHENPVKARLCSFASEWEFSSAYCDQG